MILKEHKQVIIPNTDEKKCLVSTLQAQKLSCSPKKRQNTINNPLINSLRDKTSFLTTFLHIIFYLAKIKYHLFCN